MARTTDDKAPRRPYCLRCYAALESIEPPRSTCTACGFLNVEIDRQIFWTKERRLREWEDVAKGVIVVLVGGISLAALFGAFGTMSLGMGQGWAVGFPLLFGTILWETASKITRWKPYFRATIVWSGIALILGAAPLAIAVVADEPGTARALLLAAAGVFFLLAMAIRRFGRVCERWRDRRILSGSQT